MDLKLIFAVLLMASDFREIIGGDSDEDDMQGQQLYYRDLKNVQKKLEISKLKKEQREAEMLFDNEDRDEDVKPSNLRCMAAMVTKVSLIGLIGGAFFGDASGSLVGGGLGAVGGFVLYQIVGCRTKAEDDR